MNAHASFARAKSLTAVAAAGAAVTVTVTIAALPVAATEITYTAVRVVYPDYCGVLRRHVKHDRRTPLPRCASPSFSSSGFQ